MRTNFLLFCAFLAFFGCRNGSNSYVAKYIHLNGDAMGTTFHISYLDSLGRSFQAPVDSILDAFNKEVSTYDSSSVISRFNRSAEPFELGFSAEEASTWPIPAPGHRRGAHFVSNYFISLDYYHRSKGAFDPTVMPLVNYWGFGYTGDQPVEKIDSVLVDSLLDLVGLDRVLALEGSRMTKISPAVQLDFNAIAPGYCVDLLGRFLEAHGIRNYLVEIGGEVLARGLNDNGEPWKIGINTPSPEAGLEDIKAIVGLKDRALATSGNYRKFFEVNGMKYAHTINPKTGYPEMSNLLSATILAPSCTEADAMATACMVMGLDQAFGFISSQAHLDGYFIFSRPDGSMDVRHTQGMEALLVAE